MDEMVQLLLAHGANVNIANLEGDIPKVVRTSEQVSSTLLFINSVEPYWMVLQLKLFLQLRPLPNWVPLRDHSLLTTHLKVKLCNQKLQKNALSNKHLPFE